MSYALVRNDVGDFMVVNADLVSDRTLGAAVKVVCDLSDDWSTGYNALLIDMGTNERMQSKHLEVRDMSLPDIQTMLSNARRMRRANSVAHVAAPPPQSVTRRSRTAKGPAGTATVAIPPLASSVDPTDTLDDREMLRAIYREVTKANEGIRDLSTRMAQVEDEMASIRSFIELATDERESDGINLTAIARSMETQEEVISTVEKGITHITETMPQKLPINYLYLTEEEVNKLDCKEDSSAVFAGKVAEQVFPEEELFMLVDDRDQAIYNWIVDLVYRRRAYSEHHATRSLVQSRVRAQLNQQARRLRDATGMAHPVPIAKRKKADREARLEEIREAVEGRTEEIAAKRKRVNDARVNASASKQLRQKGLIDNDGDDILFPTPGRMAISNFASTPSGPNGPKGGQMTKGLIPRSLFPRPQQIAHQMRPNAAQGTNSRLCYPSDPNAPGPSRQSVPDTSDMPMLEAMEEDEGEFETSFNDPFEF